MCVVVMGTCFSRGLINNIFPVWNFIHFLRCFMCSFPLCVVFVFHGFSFRSAVSLSLHLHTGFPSFPFPCVVCTHSITRPCKCMPFLWHSFVCLRVYVSAYVLLLFFLVRFSSRSFIEIFMHFPPCPRTTLLYGDVNVRRSVSAAEKYHRGTV